MVYKTEVCNKFITWNIACEFGTDINIALVGIQIQYRIVRLTVNHP